MTYLPSPSLPPKPSAHRASPAQRRLLCAALATAWLLPACAVREGIAGKDAIWIATPQALVTRMLEMARVTPQDLVVDLGSGDGKIIIAAARDFGARGLGIEYNAQLVELSRRHAQEAGVASRVTFVQGDIFEAQYGEATVVALYLLPNLMLRLRHSLMALRPGTRIVAHQYGLGEWEPDRTDLVEGRKGMLWIVPANAGGRWRLRWMAEGVPQEAELTLTQTFQRLSGRVQWPAAEPQAVEAQAIEGARGSLSFRDAQGRLHRFEGRIEGDAWPGQLLLGGAAVPAIAERLGPAPRIIGSTPVNLADQERARIDGL